MEKRLSFIVIKGGFNSFVFNRSVIKFWYLCELPEDIEQFKKNGRVPTRKIPADFKMTCIRLVDGSTVFMDFRYAYAGDIVKKFTRTKELYMNAALVYLAAIPPKTPVVLYLS